MLDPSTMEAAMSRYDQAEPGGILPDHIEPFSVGHYSGDLGLRLVVSAQGLLGVGAYGAVYEAALALSDSAANESHDGTAEGTVGLLTSPLCKMRKAIVAVKYQALPDEAMLLNNLAAELALLYALSFSSGGGCPYLLRFYGAAVLSPPPPPRTCVQPFEPGSTCVAMAFEVAREGDLESRVVRARREMNAALVSTPGSSPGNTSTASAAESALAKVLPWYLRVRVCQEVASALDFLHCQEIVHRDIKTANILLDGDFHAKLCDFGLAIGDAAPLKDVFVGGTDAYMAPEMLLAEGYSTPADVFSLGLVMASLLALSPVGEPYTADVPVALTPTLIDDDDAEASSYTDDEGDDSNEQSSNGLSIVLEVSPLQEESGNGSTNNENSTSSTQLTPLSPILGRSPRSFFEADSAEIRAASLPGCPEAFLELCLACCASDPNDRPLATDLAALLDAVLADLDAAQPEAEANAASEAPGAATEETAGSTSSMTSAGRSANLPRWCPPPSPPTPLEAALPVVSRELARWQKRLDLRRGRQATSTTEEESSASLADTAVAVAAVDSGADEKAAGEMETGEASLQTHAVAAAPVPFDNSELADTADEAASGPSSGDGRSGDESLVATADEAPAWAAEDTTATTITGRTTRSYTLPADVGAGGMATDVNKSTNRVAGAGQRLAPNTSSSSSSSSGVLPPRPKALPPKPTSKPPPPGAEKRVPPLLSALQPGGYTLPPRPPDPSSQLSAAAAEANLEAATAVAELNREMEEEEAAQSAAAGAARQTLVATLAEQVKMRGEACDAASKVPPQELIGCWVYVDGLGLGKVAAFHKIEPGGVTGLLSGSRLGQDSYHTVELATPASAAIRAHSMLLNAFYDPQQGGGQGGSGTVPGPPTESPMTSPYSAAPMRNNSFHARNLPRSSSMAASPSPRLLASPNRLSMHASTYFANDPLVSPSADWSTAPFRSPSPTSPLKSVSFSSLPTAGGARDHPRAASNAWSFAPQPRLARSASGALVMHPATRVRTDSDTVEMVQQIPPLAASGSLPSSAQENHEDEDQELPPPPPPPLAPLLSPQPQFSNNSSGSSGQKPPPSSPSSPRSTQIVTPPLRRVRCLLRRRKLGSWNDGQFFVLVQEDMLNACATTEPEVAATDSSTSQSNSNNNPDSSASSHSVSNVSNLHGNSIGGGGDNSGSDQSPTVVYEGVLKLERPPLLGTLAKGKHSGIFKERHFRLVLPPPPPLEAFMPGAPFLPAASVYPALVYAQDKAKPHKVDAQHCCLLATESAACAEDSANDPQKKRLRVGGRWTLEATDSEAAAAWLSHLKSAVVDRQALVRSRQVEARAAAEAELRAPLNAARARPALLSQSTFR